MTEKEKTPEHSLPSYREPTPETHERISREEEAERALTTTTFTPGARLILVVAFLLTIISLPLINLATRLRHQHNRSPGAEVLSLLPSRSEWQSLTRGDWRGFIPTAKEIKQAEKNLEKDSVVSQFLLPRVQSVLTGTLHAGNEQAYPGADGWLFYRPDVDHITGPPFLDPARLKQRARDLGLQPDPVKAIVHFKDQLAARGLELILLPIPSKPAVDANHLSRHGPHEAAVENLSLRPFLAEMEAHGVRVVNLSSSFAEKAEDLYLRTDTHWTPETMQIAAAQVSARLTAKSQSSLLVSKQVTSLGDIATMLKLPHQQTLFHPQTVTIQQVQNGNSLWRSDSTADVLLLGDSFSNIYSLAALGWGEGAGLAEQISHLARRPIDTILRNSDGAFATREILSQELRRGKDRLAGKKVVIWEFAERELSFGDWKLLDLTLGTPPPPADFLTIPDGQEFTVDATVTEVSTVPRPGTVPYRDHILSVHLEEIAGGKNQARAYLWSMRDNRWTAAARLRPGNRVRVKLTTWPGSDPSREQFNRSELLDADLQLEEPLWAELIEPQ